MPKYIDAEWLMKAVDGNLYVTDSVKTYVRCTVRKIPAADVEPKRKTGRWIDLDDHLLCSSCGASHTGPDKNYCPNCGAKMDEEDDNG